MQFNYGQFICRQILYDLAAFVRGTALCSPNTDSRLRLMLTSFSASC
jgi:hypothetical protein